MVKLMEQLDATKYEVFMPKQVEAIKAAHFVASSWSITFTT
jgi:hypothetical protein